MAANPISQAPGHGIWANIESSNDRRDRRVSLFPVINRLVVRDAALANGPVPFSGREFSVPTQNRIGREQ